MRRFSQRSGLVTLSEINITPLLDLAFVLLIIFVITTPLLEQGLPVTLPSGGNKDQKIERENLRTVEIDKLGAYMLDKKSLSLDLVMSSLTQAYQRNTNLVVWIRADKSVPFEKVFDLTDRCRKVGLHRFDWRAIPPDARR